MAILIVDDSTDHYALLRSILTKAGHDQILGAESAQTAFSMLNLDGTQSATDVDLILMDVLMPEIDGVQACRRIKQQTHLRDIPIIMVTAKNDLENLHEAFTAGAMDYINKPVKSVELLARVASAITLKKEMDCRKLRESELRRTNEELQQALREVKVLRGLIPICASCKKIRNDGGFWQQIEEYIGEHSEAEFSHGICQPCLKKLYPGVYQD
ncbi:MAG: response regulator [Nitrospira sp.]|jgi:CheY-like chemotaxis protein|nr:response regulator [Nitrospira sp.]MBK9948492.1 response regulator [Nitrospira sp.]MBL8053430.1 response regulator [Nitrospira sp.]OYT19177.1 MAG: response regulator [Nitrospira sp. UW-LDO-01]